MAKGPRRFGAIAAGMAAALALTLPLVGATASGAAMRTECDDVVGHTSCGPVVVTTVNDTSTTMAWTGTEVTGASAYDTATITIQQEQDSALRANDVQDSHPTFTYNFYATGDCSGDPVWTQTVDVTEGGGVPDSNSTDPLGAGQYSFLGTLNHNGEDENGDVSGACEPFTVGKADPSVTTVVNNAGTNAPWAGNETAGAAAYDTAAIHGGITGFTPTGNVTYTFFSNGTCAPTGTTETVALAAGVPGHSSNTAALAAGSYSFQAQYLGDSNYTASALGACEPFTVLAAGTVTSPTTPTTPTSVATSPTTPIAFTGANVTGLLFASLGLLGAGSLLVLASRRRRPQRAKG
jgi:hypothetical protein